MKQEMMQSDLPQGLARDKVKKHVAAIHSSGNLSLVARKLSNILLLHAYDRLLSDRTHQLPVRVLYEVLGWENSRNTSGLKKALTELATTPIEFDVMKQMEEEDWSICSCISYGAIKGGMCIYRYDEAMAERLYNPSRYGLISGQVQKSLTGSYSLNLYENVNRYIGVGSTGYWDLQALRKMLGVTQEYYDDFRRLNSKIIQKAVQDINSNSDINITEVELQKDGRTVTAVKFLLETKPQETLFTHGETPEVEELKLSPLYKRLLEHNIGERLALDLLAGRDQDRIERIISLADKKLRRGEIKQSSAGFIRRMVESGADVQPSAQESKRAAAQVEEQRQRDAHRDHDLRVQWERQVRNAAMNSLTPEETVELARKFITTDEGRLFANEFAPQRKDPFPNAIARLAFRRWLPLQMGHGLTDADFEAYKTSLPA
ncbi:replication initiation protein [Cupriavidus pauculus]|uniref:replication initiation protein n=1 Tax=Cupriavidus pauculus TaxID=82633 RepID=UPI0038578FE1